MVRHRETAHLRLPCTTISGITSYLISCTMFLSVSCGQCRRRQNPLRKVGRYGGATTFASKNFCMMVSWSGCHWLGSSGDTQEHRAADEVRGDARDGGAGQPQVGCLPVPHHPTRGPQCIPSWPGRHHRQQGEDPDLYAADQG